LPNTQLLRLIPFALDPRLGRDQAQHLRMIHDRVNTNKKA
jgi:hypothetical protein